MRYFKNLKNQQVYGYDPQDQEMLIEKALGAGWEEVTGSWPPPPSEESLKQSCKLKAKQLLLDTDFSQASDVAAVLENKAEFDTYRTTIRALFLSPVVDPQWPVTPVARWLLNA
jgi:hypothetical protein